MNEKELESHTKEIVDFLIMAHAARNGTSENEVTKNKYGVYEYIFEAGKFLFLNQYVSNGYNIGLELVSEKKDGDWVPIWQMNYQGTFLIENKAEVYSFLRAALQLVNFDKCSLPIRGPREMTTAVWKYENICSSKSIGNFSGKETISRENNEVYNCLYYGFFLNVLNQENK